MNFQIQFQEISVAFTRRTRWNCAGNFTIKSILSALHKVHRLSPSHPFCPSVWDRGFSLSKQHRHPTKQLEPITMSHKHTAWLLAFFDRDHLSRPNSRLAVTQAILSYTRHRPILAVWQTCVQQYNCACLCSSQSHSTRSEGSGLVPEPASSLHYSR